MICYIACGVDINAEPEVFKVFSTKKDADIYASVMNKKRNSPNMSYYEVYESEIHGFQNKES